METLNDIKSLKELINKHVEITIIGGKSYSGLVYVVDPISKCIVINDIANKNTNIIFEHAVKSMKISNNNSEEMLKTNTEVDHIITEEEHTRRIKLKKWLTKNLAGQFEVEDDGRTLKIGPDLVIEPPYDKEHCFSGSASVLSGVVKMIDSMPIDE